MSKVENDTGSSILNSLFEELPRLDSHYAPGTKVYARLKQKARREVERLFSSEEPVAREFGPFGSLILPYYKMGAVDSLNLFDFDELIIFSFYRMNRKRYRRVLDIGANIGLHSIILSKCGYEVRSYEPDPVTFQVLLRNLELNGCKAVQAFNMAISSQAGEKEFIRVLGNLTGSHLAGSKPDPYGELERVAVKVEGIAPLIAWSDLMKLDVEGHEKEVLLATRREHWLKTDALVEVENQDNARAIYRHLTGLGVNLFPQKINWQPAGKIDDIPTSYREGTLFVSCKNEMPWTE